MSPTARILVVEDQYFVAVDCELTLQTAGYECVGLATTADEAVQLANAEHPDLVVMDIRLANRSDGVQAAIDIFERFGIRSVFASGHPDAVVHRQAERAHPLGWLSKPYTPAALICAVEGALEEVVAERQKALHEIPTEEPRSGIVRALL
jgi:DNA-binding NarL/FixJ family response regulator